MTNKTGLIDALCKEIMLTKHFTDDEIIETVYVGGGTPSLLSEEELKKIFATLQSLFTFSADAEVTLEANPDDINPAILTGWHLMGINRLSVGLQSFNEEELRWMNRAHNAAQSVQCLDEIIESGFTNFSVDLIYGSPLQSNEDLRRNFEIIAQKNIPHISCYALTVEPKTALAKMIALQKSAVTDPDKQAEQFLILLNLMDAAGYEQYEISNFCKPGFRSRHNSSYWQGKSYYGFGPGAHSFDGTKTRKWNIANNSTYIDALKKNVIPFEAEVLTDDQRLNEYVMTSLRTSDGIDLTKISAQFGESVADRVLHDAGPYIQNGKLLNSSARLLLTTEGKFLADGIAAALFA